MNGMFFSFDGMDGVGKSTQIEKLCSWLSGQGREVVRCRDPGGTPLGEEIREMLLHGAADRTSRAEMLLYMASRAQLVEETIRPALAAGKAVVCDRFLLANVVYQGHAGGLNTNAIWRIGGYVTAGLRPDLTILLDMPAEIAFSRIGDAPDRLEARGLEYFQKVRQGFLAEAARLSSRVAVIDSTRDIEAIAADVQAAAAAVLAQSPHN